jgi:hypothetical protein
MLKRVKSIVVHPEGMPIYDEMATVIEIDDEGCGEFVLVKQGYRHTSITTDEWPVMRDAIEEMVSLCIPTRSKP